METRPPLPSHQAPAGPALETHVWLAAPVHALIMAAFARIFAQLERLFQLWQSGALPPPALRHPAHRTPAPKPTHRRDAAPARPRRRAPIRARIISIQIRTDSCAQNHALPGARFPAITPSTAPAPRRHPARAPPRPTKTKTQSVAKTPPSEVAKPRPFHNDIVTICPLAFPPAIGHRHRQRRKPPWTHCQTA